LLPDERRQAILSILVVNGAATVRELAEHFAVSMLTIRRDLERLENEGLITKTHGGAIVLGTNAHAEVKLTEREKQFREEKKRIGLKAADLVTAGQTVILDEGSTCLEIAKYLRQKNGITIITNGILPAAELVGNPGITLIVVGGMCNHESAMCYGPDSEHSYAALHADLYFMGIDAFSAEHGIMDGNLLQVNMKQMKAAAATKVVGVANGAKFGRRAFAKVGPLTMLHALVTENPVSPQLRRCLQENGVECIEA